MSYEIGSHFEFDKSISFKDRDHTNWLPKGNDNAFTFSGRAAIELVIKDIKNSKKLESVYMPSYCCDSMVQPFIKNNIKVIYYGVEYDSERGIVYSINPDTECDIFFAMSYFGLEHFKLDKIITEFSNKGCLVIEDMTHRMLCVEAYSPAADYSIGSIRKWFGVPTGGYASKREGVFSIKPHIDSDNLVEQKVVAMQEKLKYLHGYNVLKDSFLNKFGEFEQKLKFIDSDYMIDKISFEIITSIDIEAIREQRISNAKVLYKGLKGFNFIEPLISDPDFEKGCPLFVPVLIRDGERDNLREYLIQHSIYCPIHWPSKLNEYSTILESELSLICDHRYTKTDMEYILKKIRQWINKS